MSTTIVGWNEIDFWKQKKCKNDAWLNPQRGKEQNIVEKQNRIKDQLRKEQMRELIASDGIVDSFLH